MHGKVLHVNEKKLMLQKKSFMSKKKKNRFLLQRKMFPVPKSYYFFPERCPIFRSSQPEVFLRKGVLKICSKFTGEHPCRNVFSFKEQLHVAASENYFVCGKFNLGAI